MFIGVRSFHLFSAPKPDRHVDPILLLKGQGAITADTANCLAHYLRTSAELGLNLQNDDEMRTLREKIAVKIYALVEPMAA